MRVVYFFCVTEMSRLFRLESLLLSVFSVGCSSFLLLPVSIFFFFFAVVSGSFYILNYLLVTCQARFLEAAEGDIFVTSKVTQVNLCVNVYVLLCFSCRVNGCIVITVLWRLKSYPEHIQSTQVEILEYIHVCRKYSPRK